MNKHAKPEITELNEQRLSGIDADDFATALRRTRNGEPVVTLLMPMERRGPDIRKNHIIFKNLLREAQQVLSSGAQKSPQMAARLTALERFDAPTHHFWQNQDEGLAMVVQAEGKVTAYKVPFPLEPFVRIDRQPYLGPLLRLAGGKTYHVLSIDLEELKLYRATAWELEEVELADVPKSLAEAMKFDDPEESLQVRGVVPQVAPAAQGGGGGGRPSPAYHGHGATSEETRNIKIRRFFEMVDKNLAANFRNRETPLVLLGPPSEAGIFRNVNSYPHLLDEAIFVNPSALTGDELRERICGWVREQDLRDREQALATLSDNIGIGEGSTDFSEVVKGASDGRVSTLFVKGGQRRYGVNDRGSDQVIVRDEPQEGDDELVETTVLAAAEGGATIHYLENGENLPDNACLAAIFRYKLTEATTS